VNPNRRPLALVVRVSDVGGRDKKGDRFISPTEQIRTATRYARDAGFEVEVVEPQDLNVSHTTPLDQRPAMGQALRLVEEGKRSGIVVSSQDRLGTLALTRELRARLLQAGGVLKVADNPSAELLDARGYAKLPAEQMSLMHEAQREEIGLRWQAAQRSAVARGIHICAWVPVGYDRGDDRRLVPNGYAPVVRRVFELRAQSGSWAECAAVLRDAGVPNRLGNTHWTKSAVQAMIRNPVYTGEARYGQIRNPHGHDPIVDPALFRAANEVRGRRGRPSERSLLSGLLRCASCGRQLYASTSDHGGGRYRCRPYMLAGPPCDAPAGVQQRHAEEFVQRTFVALLPLYTIAPEAGPDTAPLKQAVAAAKASYEAWLAADISDIDAAAFRAGALERKARLEEAEDALRAAQTAPGVEAEAATLHESWYSLSLSERRRWLAQFEVGATVRRGREPVHERVEFEMRNTPVRTELLEPPGLPVRFAWTLADGLQVIEEAGPEPDAALPEAA
jgi:DNA invertase Pin-like site-specific DNA recombinase